MKRIARCPRTSRLHDGVNVVYAHQHSMANRVGGGVSSGETLSLGRGSHCLLCEIVAKVAE